MKIGGNANSLSSYCRAEVFLLERMKKEMIRLEHVTKSFQTKDGEVHAVKDVSLEVREGQIYGIIGFSGAGKSTLVRCINLLERPDDGKVIFDGKNLLELPDKELRAERQKMGMIFQHFNLLRAKTIYENIALPLRMMKKDKQEIDRKVMELLELIDLVERKDSYPSQLSGGQKQRVAIARALATNPKILLCDEATSALDPTTTKSILALLKEINERYGITIVIITHEMAVVQEICTHVAIIDGGSLAETGTVEEVFARPKTSAAKRLVFQNGGNYQEMKGKHCIRIVFKENSSFEPVIANMVLECKTPANILLADTKDIGGVAHGQMILQLPEDDIVAGKMISYLKERKLEVEELDNYVG